jgi:SAM-dependent methyltransferase
MAWWTEHVVPRATDWALRGRELGDIRARVCAGLEGRLLEIGFGGGLNLRHLPADVTAVGAVEPSDLGWILSERRRRRSSLPVGRIGLDGQAVDAPDASYDAALCTFSLCTIPDPLAALAEVRRLVRPGGSFRFLEHGRSDDPRLARRQRLLEPLQRRLAGGCHLTRDPAALIEQSGMTLHTLERGPLAGFAGPAVLTYAYLGRATV